jgi:hypothetical protein
MHLLYDLHCTEDSYCHMTEWLLTGFGLAIGIAAYLQAQLVTSSNYNSLIGLHTLKFTATAAYTTSSMSSLVVSW